MGDSDPVGLPALLAACRGAAAADDATIDDFLALHAAPGADPYTRARLDAHFTASAFVVDRTGARTLLTHHRKLGLWLQPGGHADGGRDLVAVALREAQEETGVAALSIVPVVFDLDRHRIPAHREVPAHWHYDVRFVVHASDDERYVVSDESHALEWRDIAALLADADADPSLRRMAGRWLEQSA